MCLLTNLGLTEQPLPRESCGQCKKLRFASKDYRKLLIKELDQAGKMSIQMIRQIKSFHVKSLVKILNQKSNYQLSSMTTSQAYRVTEIF